jgi:hypothetical protein
MKTTLLFSAALFLATASFAQTQANSHATVKGKSEIKTDKVKSNSSSEANLQSNAIKSGHKAAAAEKSSVSATANDKGKLISGIASDKSDAAVQGKEKGQLISSIASDGKSKSGSVHADAKAVVKANSKNKSHVKTHVRKIRHSGKKIKATSANTVHTTAHAVKIKPVQVKANTGVKVHIK